jgi:RNA polymerase sigma factor (sigma-70 family)
MYTRSSTRGTLDAAVNGTSRTSGVADREAPEAQAFGDAVYRSYTPELLRFATGLVGPCDAADIVHDVVVRCLQASTWERVVDKRAYLYRAVENASSSHHRACGRRQDRVRLASSCEQFVTYEPEVRAEIWAAVLTLSVRQRAVIVLTYWLDMAPQQVAERLQIGEGSVKQHLARGRDRLRRVLSEGQAPTR